MPKDRGAFTRERGLPQNINPQGTRCVRFTLPDDDQWESILLGQLEPLTRWMTWAYDEQKQGTIVAKRWRDIVFTYARCDEDCAAPFWYDSPDEAEEDCDPDEDDSALWEVADWAVSAFLFVTATPAAALTYKTFAPKIRNLFRAPSVGAICDIVVNGLLYASVPTSAATAGVSVGDAIPVTIDIAAHNIANNIIPFPQPANIQYIHRLPAAGGGEPMPMATLEIIRSRVKPATLCDDVFDVKPSWQVLAQAWFDCYGDDLPMAALRQKPGEPCILQQQTLTGWQDVYDFSLCPPASNSSQDYTVYQDIQNTINNYNNTWNNNPTVNNFAPDTVYDNTPADDDRNEALCYALDVLYEAIKLVAVDVAENPDARPLFEIVVSAVFAMSSVAAAALTGGAATPAALAAIAALGGAIGNAVATLPFGWAAGATDSDFSTAKEAIQCCMFAALANATVLEADFQTSVNSCGFAPGSADENVRLIVAQLLQNRDMYLSFLKFFQESVGIVELGYPLPECPCEEPPTPSWCVEFDFAVSQHGWLINTGPYGTWQNGTGFVSSAVNESGVYSQRVYVRYPAIDARQITNVEIIYNYTKGTFTPPGAYWAIAANLNSDSSPDYGNPVKLESAMANGNDQTLMIDYPDLERTQVRVDMRASRMTTSPPNGAITLKKLRVTGLGDKPSQWAAIPDCSEWCIVFDAANGLDLWQGWDASQPTWDGTKWVGTGYTYNGVLRRQVGIVRDLNINATLTRVEFTYALTKGTFDNPDAIVNVIENDETDVILASSTSANTPNTASSIFSWTGNATVRHLRLQVVSSRTADEGSCSISRVLIRGTGPKPTMGGPC